MEQNQKEKSFGRSQFAGIALVAKAEDRPSSKLFIEPVSEAQYRDMNIFFET